MIFAEDCQGQLEDKAVYIVGSGPSLDSYPDDFLDDKSDVTLHLAYLKFPDATYRGVCEALIIKWMLANRPEFFTKKNIFTSPFHPAVKPQHLLGLDLGTSRGWPAPIFIRYAPDRDRFTRVDFGGLVRKAIAGQPIIGGSYSTVLHSILFAVLTMGAKEIHLMGCDHAKSPKGEVYYSLAQEVEASGLRIRDRGKRWYRPEMCQRQQRGTDMFIKECRSQDVSIKRHADYDDWGRQNL